MLSKIKLWLGVAGAAIMAALFAMLKIKSAQLDKAESDVEKLADINKQNKEVNKVEDDIKKATDDVNAMSNDDIDNSMHKYDRSRKDGD